ncbi:MAG: aminopeptidase [Gammaproteobacteria bacterium]|nr:MAG: aminopeptidase [Gammaproteobacteria bacterium]
MIFMRFKPDLKILLVFFISSALLSGGCTKLAYYRQSVSGHLDVINKRRDISDILADPDAAPELKQKLEAVLKIRAFAVTELALPDNESYQSYADIERPFVVWNVFATPKLSVTPESWCFLFAGCVSYRGYFSKEKAHEFAGKLSGQDLDVYVAGITAYSTLGWFDDPVLNTVINKPLPDLAGLVFHELAHQKIYVKGDTRFNESFATAVELEGIRRWLNSKGLDSDYASYLERKKKRDEFVALVLRYRDKLRTLYQSEKSNEEKLIEKQKYFSQLKQEYRRIKVRWGGYEHYDNWFSQDLNNAHLASMGAYYSLVPGFQALLKASDYNLKLFYQRVDEIGRLNKSERLNRLQETFVR